MWKPRRRWNKECPDPTEPPGHLCKLKSPGGGTVPCSEGSRDQLLPHKWLRLTNRPEAPSGSQAVLITGLKLQVTLTWHVNLLISWLIWEPFILSQLLTRDLFPLKTTRWQRYSASPDWNSFYSACALPLVYILEEM